MGVANARRNLDVYYSGTRLTRTSRGRTKVSLLSGLSEINVTDTSFIDTKAKANIFYGDKALKLLCISIVGRNLYYKTRVKHRQEDRMIKHEKAILLLFLFVCFFFRFLGHNLKTVQCLQFGNNCDSGQKISVRKTGLTMYDSLSLGTQKRACCPY